MVKQIRFFTFYFLQTRQTEIPFVMDQEENIRAQEAVQCDLCNTPHPPLHCVECQVNVCKTCVGDHLTDLLIDHKVVPFQNRGTVSRYLQCQSHPKKQCELHCNSCDIPVCNTCLLSNSHKGHILLESLEVIRSKKEVIKKDFEAIQNFKCQKYEDIVNEYKNEKSKVETCYTNLSSMVTKQGEIWCREVNKVVYKLQTKIEEMKKEHLTFLHNQEDEIKNNIADVKQSILDLKKIRASDDLYMTATYKSRSAVLKKFPPKPSFPSFTAKKIDSDQLSQQFGSLMTNSQSFPQTRPLVKEPQVIATFTSGYKGLRSVASLNENEIWAFGNNSIIKLYNDRGEQLKSIQTKSRNEPIDIALTKSGDLMYADHHNQTVNIVKGKEIEEVIKLVGWRPLSISVSTSGDLLVMMNSDRNKQARIVRFTGSTEKQIIQFDVEGQPLYSTGTDKFLTGNTNLDVCVADSDGRTVVVVRSDGRLRFRYSGHVSSGNTFDPKGIATDCQGRILIADYEGDFIHILDMEGQFLQLISWQFNGPKGISVDANNYLLIADYKDKVSKFQYCS